jgi:hypothetical protein
MTRTQAMVGIVPNRYPILSFLDMVLKTGVEPARPNGHMPLKHACLPFHHMSMWSLDRDSDPANRRYEGRSYPVLKAWCEWRDSNPQDLSHCALNTACLPISPHSHGGTRGKSNPQSAQTEACRP